MWTLRRPRPKKKGWLCVRLWYRQAATASLPIAESASTLSQLSNAPSACGPPESAWLQFRKPYLIVHGKER